MRLSRWRILSRPACLALSIVLFGGASDAVAAWSGAARSAHPGAQPVASAHKRRCISSRRTKTQAGAKAADVVVGLGTSSSSSSSAAWAWGWGWKPGPYFSGSSEQAKQSTRRCAAAKHKTPARHGISTSTPTSGPAGTIPSGSGTPGAPVQATTPAGEAPAESGKTIGSPPVVSHVQVISVEYHYTLSKTTVPAGKVAFDFVNDGQDEHNLNVLSGEGSLTGSFPNTVSKGVRDQTIEMRAGTYTLFCSLPEHEAKGMKATLTVQ
jgi:plastocyanin